MMRRARHYPVQPEPRRTRRLLQRAAAAPPLSALPEHVSLWDSGHMPDIWNQQQEGSCTGHGWARAAEFLRRAAGFAPMMPSRQFIYCCERIKEGSLNQDNGAQIGDGASVLSDFGVCEESLWPYDATTAFTLPNPSAFQQAALHKLLGYTRTDPTPEAACAALAAGKPVVFGFQVFDSFEAADTARTGTVPMPAAGEKNLGGHCVVFDGYTITSVGASPATGWLGWLQRLFGKGHGASDGWLYFSNSWGNTWGMAGRGRMSFDFVRKYAYDFTVPQAMTA